MGINERIAGRYFEERYARLFSAMSLQEAKSILGFPASASPTPDEVAKAYKRKAIENHPDRGGSHEKMVEVNVAKDILDGKQRPTGPAKGWRPSTPSRPTYEDYVKREEAKKVRTGDDFHSAKTKAPTNVQWKFRSVTMVGSANEFTKGQGINSYVAAWVCYGQTEGKHVFMLVEHAVPNPYTDKMFDSWSMEVTDTYPASQDIEKLVTKAVKALLTKGKLADKLKPATKYVAFDTLSEAELSKGRSGGVALKDILIGTGLSSGAASDRKVVVEIDGKLNAERMKKDKASGVNYRTAFDYWRWYDFTLYVNGKGYLLSQDTMENLGKQGTSGGLFWMAVYSPVQYDYSRRRVLTKIPRYGSAILEMVESSLSGEPSELTVSLLKAIEDMETKKTASEALDDFLAAKIALRYVEE